MSVTLKEALQDALVDCNYILKAWANHKPRLLNQQDVRGLVVFHIQKAINRAFNYKQLRDLGRFTRIHPADVQWHDKEYYITSIYFSVMQTGTLSAQVQQTLNDIDLSDMHFRSLLRAPGISVRTLDNFTLVDLQALINY